MVSQQPGLPLASRGQLAVQSAARTGLDDAEVVAEALAEALAPAAGAVESAEAEAAAEAVTGAAAGDGAASVEAWVVAAPLMGAVGKQGRGGAAQLRWVLRA